MAKIYIETFINAEIQKVFDFSRDIDLHKISTSGTNEKAIAGRTFGLIELGETVTWEAKHLGVLQTFTSKITEMNSPENFVDEMQKGAFKSFRHQHIFEEKNGKTLMIDKVEFHSPFGIIGRIFNAIFLKNYLKKFLVERNAYIKKIAEESI